MALDTGMRRGEVLTLLWGDVSLDTGIITIQAFNTKTQQERIAIMTPRLRQELILLYDSSPHESTDRIFGITDNVSKSFKSACMDAGIDGAKFHDLRHCFGTRLDRLHMSEAEISKLMGHTQTRTTRRYLNIDIETARRAADLLASLYKQSEAPESTLVN